MNDLPELQIRIAAPISGLPGELIFSLDMIDAESISPPQELYDSQTPVLPMCLADNCNPILVFRDGSSHHTILDGCKRYAAARQQNKRHILCAVLETQLDCFSTGLLRMVLNAGRPHHLRERAMMLSWLRKNCSEDNFNVTATAVGVSPKEIQLISQLLSTTEQVKNAVFNEQIDLSLVPLFLVFTVDDQVCFLETFYGLGLSRQTQREFFEWLPELAYIQKCSIRDILSNSAIRDTLSHPSINAPQKIEKIRTFLYERKYPQLSAAQRMWKKQSIAVNPDPSCITFVPDPFFEKDRLTITIAVTSGKKAETLFKKCAEISADAWQKLIYPSGTGM